MFLEAALPGTELGPELEESKFQVWVTRVSEADLWRSDQVLGVAQNFPMRKNNL